MTTVREFLKQYNKVNGFGTDEYSLIEALVDSGEVVHREGRDEHRWYICETVVKNIDGTYIKYIDYLITGDSCMNDLGLKYDIDAASIVERKERQVTEVYYT